MTRNSLRELIDTLEAIHARWIHYDDEMSEEHKETDRRSQDEACGAIWRFLTVQWRGRQ